MKKYRLYFLSMMVVFSLILSACAAAKSANDSVTVSPESEYVYSESPALEEDVEDSRSPGISGTASAVDRMVIYNADLSIAVESPDAVMETVIQMAEDAGGFVVSSNLSKAYTSSGASVPRANLTVRVPAGQLESIMGAIKALTPNPKEDVLSENVSGQDVTAEYTDLESRLRNLEAAEAALVVLMDQAETTEDVLNVFDELTYYRGEIEVVKGRMQYLEESAALSSLTVEIVAKESLQPIEIAGWEPKGTAKRAVEALINTGQFLADSVIWFGIYCLPFLIPLGVAAYFLVKLIRNRRLRRKAAKATQPEVIEPQEPKA